MHKDSVWRGILASSVFHLVIVMLIIVPVVTMDVRDMREKRQASGLDQLGGGGGGRGGTGGVAEEIFYLNVDAQAGDEMLETPTVAPPPPMEEPPEPVPVPEKEPIPPPEAPVPPQVEPEPPAVPTSSSDTGTASLSQRARVAGAGGGTGNDGSDGNGPGRGGGVGTGVGTGSGSGVGPGISGGGTDSIRPPTLLTLGLPPLQPPSRVRPYTLVALFDVDEKGKTTLIGFNETRDGRFNRQLRQVLSDVRFKPATLLDGTPVRDTGRFVIQYP